MHENGVPFGVFSKDNLANFEWISSGNSVKLEGVRTGNLLSMFTVRIGGEKIALLLLLLFLFNTSLFEKTQIFLSTHHWKISRKNPLIPWVFSRVEKFFESPIFPHSVFKQKRMGFYTFLGEFQRQHCAYLIYIFLVIAYSRSSFQNDKSS